MDFTEGYAEGSGNVSKGFALRLQSEDVFNVFQAIVRFGILQMVAFLVETLLFEAKEAVLLVDVIDYHVVGIVLVATCADLDLFEVA